MRKIVITGTLGQIGTELILKCRKLYGKSNVLATDIKELEPHSLINDGPFELLDVTDRDAMMAIVEGFRADTLMHMVTLLSTTAEKNPLQTWDLNMGGLMSALEAARMYDLHFFTPSSVRAFGAFTPKKNTPQNTIQQPTTMYGINKITGGLSCQYYFKKFGVDTRSVGFPELISHTEEPGGGTIDYTVEVYFEAIKYGHYTSCIARHTYIDVVYMSDAVDTIIQLIEADNKTLVIRNGYNLSTMSFEPRIIKKEIQKHIPESTLDYDVGPIRQAITDTWLDNTDTSYSRKEWGFNPKYHLAKMIETMIQTIKENEEKT